MLALARLAARECGAHFLLLSRADPATIAEAAAGAGLDPAYVTCRAAEYADIPRYLRRATAGLAFIRPVPSKRGSSPTKVAEYLACGVPVIANTGVGDLEDFVEQEGVGVLLRSFSEDELARAARFVATAAQERADVRRRCVEVAARRFDLHEVGVSRYARLYEAIGAR
jgi:glycosyltransferase involved in cell wall biosynthesis